MMEDNLTPQTLVDSNSVLCLNFMATSHALKFNGLDMFVLFFCQGRSDSSSIRQKMVKVNKKLRKLYLKWKNDKFRDMKRIKMVRWRVRSLNGNIKREKINLYEVLTTFFKEGGYFTGMSSLGHKLFIERGDSRDAAMRSSISILDRILDTILGDIAEEKRNGSIDTHLVKQVFGFDEDMTFT